MKKITLLLLLGGLISLSVRLYAQETVTVKRQLISKSDRSDWKFTASSAQALSDAGKGGPATLLADGDATSYWHSEWGKDVLPGATIDVDFGKTQVITAVLLQQRDMETRKIKGIKLYFKAKETDTWGTAKYSGSLTNVATMQTVKLSTKQTSQFMRLEVISKIDGTKSNVCLAELGVEVNEVYAKAEYAAMKAFLELSVNQTVDKITATTKANWSGAEQGTITPYLTLNSYTFITAEGATEKAFKLTTNVKSWTSWKIADWINVVEDREAKTITASVQENSSLEGRGDTLYVAGAGILKKVPIKQSGLTIPNNLIPTDIYIKPSGGKSTTQYSPDHSIINLWDRNPSGTNYHSAVNHSSSPVTETLEFYFSQKPAVIDYLIYVPAAGNVSKMTIYTKTDNATTYTKLGEFDWSGVGKFTFPEPLKNATGIKLEFQVPGNGGLIAIKEVEFWAVNNDAPLNIALLKVFTDLSCSELKPEASEADIAALLPMFQKIAEKLKAGTYQKEYRIDNFEAYSDPDKFAGLRNTNAYSLWDNPTGIYANAGDDIYVFVGDTHGQAVSLMSVSPGSTANDKYTLKEGINKVRITRSGLMYISYIADLTQNPQPIKIHIPEGSGVVNGYWDITKNTGAQWRGILAKATHSVIDIVGKSSHFIIFTDELRKNLNNPGGDDISKSVEIWDGLVEAGWKLMGFDKYPLPQNNRMCGFSMDMDTHMYATWYHTGYSRGTIISEVLYPGCANGNRLWGIGHEVGHCQQHPFNWRSMSESSNNTFAQVALEEVINQKVRKINDNDPNSLKNAASDMIPACDGLNEALNGTPNHDIGGWSKWGNIYYAFYLYFNKVGINPDFYKDIFESLRKNGLGDNYYVGERHLNWYKRVCDIAQIDFTEHFEANGYFTPINVKNNQYGDYEMIVTKATADAAKAYVASKNYPKPKYRTQFMHQTYTTRDGSQYMNGYWTYYRDNAQIRSDISCSVSGSTVTVRNGMEAVAFAVETDGKIVYYGDRNTFTVPTGKWNATSKIYAVPVETAKSFIQIYPKL